MSDNAKGYFNGKGKHQSLYARISKRQKHSDAYSSAIAMYWDHYNNGSWNTFDSSLEDVRHAKISKAKRYLDSLDRIQQCFSDYREFCDSTALDGGVCPCCGHEMHDACCEVWVPDKYNEAFETMIDFAVLHESKLLKI